MCMNGRMSVHHVCAPCLCTMYDRETVPWKPKDDIGFPEVRLTNSCELLCGYWEPNLGPLKVLLLTSEHSVQPLGQLIFWQKC